MISLFHDLLDIVDCKHQDEIKDMNVLTGDRRLVLAMIGGLLIPFVLGLNEATQKYVWLAVILPVLLGSGLVEIYYSYRDTYGSSGRAGVLLTAAGLSLLGLVVLAYAVLPPLFALWFMLAIPFVAGFVSLMLGSGLLALGLRNADLISRPAATALGLGMVFFPGFVLFPSLRAEIPSMAWAFFIGIPYGTGWVLTAHQLRTVDEIRDPQLSKIGVRLTITPNAIGAGLIGSILILVAIGRFLPLGALSSTPWVGDRLSLDILHLCVGLLGLIISVSGRAEKTRIYNQIVGISALCLGGITLLGTFLYIPGFLRLTTVLALNLPDVILYASVGIILTTLGFGVNIMNS